MRREHRARERPALSPSGQGGRCPLVDSRSGARSPGCLSLSHPPETPCPPHPGHALRSPFTREQSHLRRSHTGSGSPGPSLGHAPSSLVRQEGTLKAAVRPPPGLTQGAGSLPVPAASAWPSSGLLRLGTFVAREAPSHPAPSSSAANPISQQPLSPTPPPLPCCPWWGVGPHCPYSTATRSPSHSNGSRRPICCSV